VEELEDSLHVLSTRAVFKIILSLFVLVN